MVSPSFFKNWLNIFQKLALFGIVSGTKQINFGQVSRKLNGSWSEILFSPSNVRRKRDENENFSNGFRELAGMMLFLQGAAENDAQGREL